MRQCEVPPKYRDMHKRAMSGKFWKAAIRFYCLNCCGFREREVRLCPSSWCSLYAYRLGEVEVEANMAPNPPGPAHIKFVVQQGLASESRCSSRRFHSYL